MDSKDSLVSADKTDVSQSEAISNSKSNDKTYVEEEDKRSDKPSNEDTEVYNETTKETITIAFEKDIISSNITDENTAEVHSETNKEVTAIVSEKDAATPSNIANEDIAEVHSETNKEIITAIVSEKDAATPSNIANENIAEVHSETNKKVTTIAFENDATLSNIANEDIAVVHNETNKEATTITFENDAALSNVANEDIAEVHSETNKEATTITIENDATLSNIANEDIVNIAEVHNEINKEVTVSEKDIIPLNINTNDSALQTIEKDDNIGVEVLLSEKNTENVKIKENIVVESSCKESESVNVDKETTELSTLNLTEKCNTEHPLNLEDSCNISDNTENDSAKLTSVNETLFKDKPEDCDVPDESSVTDDLQISQKDVNLSKKVESESSDSNLENLDKDLSEKNIEPENTEFVQFSHDKHDDSQIEGQSIDAEDPFGGDNLTSENIEPVENDNLINDLAEDEISFKNLYEQGDNLQDAVNARNNDSNNDKLNVDCTSNDPKDTNVNKAVDNTVEESNVQTTDSVESAAMDIDLPDTNISEMGTESTSSTKSPVKQVEQSKKAIEEITPMETDEEQTDVLPGQDDELCIIPDSMKVIIPNKPGKTIDNEQNESVLEKDAKDDETVQKCNKSNSELDRDASSKDEPKTAVIENKNSSEDSTVATQNESTVEVQTATTDIINIDDESKSSEVEEITTKETCKQCGEERTCKIRVKIGTENYHVCSKTCKALFKAANNKTVDIPSQGATSKREKRCASCLLIIEANDERNLSWETMEFCNEECLGKFQRKYGSYCKNCNGAVQAVSLGKYCVRFGCDVRQFCCSTCLEEFKKGLKVCSYCQKDISFSTDGFLAPVGEKGQFKDFCTQDCMEKYSKLNSSEPPTTEKKSCSVCQEEKLVHCEVQIYNSTPVAICSEPCFAAFKFVKQVKPEQCSTCKKFFELPNKQHFIVFYDNEPHTFCNKTCLNIFIITNRKIVPCNWCKVKKYNFDMIKKELKTGQTLMMCSLNCLTLYQVSINAVSAKRINCDFCKEYSLAHYHLTMSDATIRNFCSYNCVMNFQAQYTKSPITIPSSDDPVPTGVPKRTTLSQKSANQIVQNSSELQSKKTMPVISSVTSLAAIGNGQASPNSQQNNMVIPTNANQSAQIIYKQQVITRPPSPVKIQNKTTQCKPLVHTKGVSVRPHPCTKWTQTKEKVQQVIVPIPVPIYVPFPMHMYSMPFPVPMPFPLPIPVPLFIPTTRNSAQGIMKDIKRIQEKIPADPYEAELLMMAEMVATEKKTNDSDSDSVDDREGDTADQDNLHSDGFSPEAVDSNNAFGDDMLQMALKMATGEIDEPAVDLEAALTPNTITATQAPPQPENAVDNDVQSERLMAASRGRKRVMPYKPRSTPAKRMRRVSGTNDMPLMPPPEPQPPPQPRIMEPMEKPDANMALKYTFGVNAWRQWVIGKNTELEKQITPMRKIKLFKTDLLQLTADELNYSLCLFVKEVRKPNGAEYAPDTIYYLCLGIQQYLFENNRIDNIFTDSYYEKFTDCLNEIAKKFSALYNEAQYIVTRVEEEHLWECKQLGAHSPHVLLSTLMFFNTKHFNLVTVEEHMQLSFSHIMKHWKRNPAAQPTAMAGKVPNSRNVLLRFYPPQSALEANSRKKKVYEQQENEENPLRCPVKLYEFYLSKCPESVKTRNDVFYLLPERSCVPDSPVWYSTSPLAKEHLIKMLYRIKMVKEINVALLTS